MKRNAIIAIMLIFLTIISCNVELMEDGENINEYIYPYLEFTPDESGEGYSVTVVGGAELEEIYIPSVIEVDGVSVHVTAFNGFENAEDAEALKVLTLASTDTVITEKALANADNLEDVIVDTTIEDARWGKLSSPERHGYEFDGWYIKGTDIRVNEGDRMIEGFTTIEPRWREHSLEYREEVKKTCVQNGIKAHYSCFSCNKLFTDEKALYETSPDDLVIPASHTIFHIEEVEPTCTVEGNPSYYRCTVCAKSFSDENAVNYLSTDDTVLPRKGHSAVNVEAEDATCTENGMSAYYRCERCTHLFSDEACTAEITAESTVIPALGHDWTYRYGERIVDGHWMECSRCHDTKESSPHSFSDETVILEPTHEKAGTKAMTCSVCSAVKTEDIMPVGDHSWKESETVSSTCEDRGYVLYRCTVAGCEAEYMGNYTDPSGHSTKYHAKENATCTEDGVEAYYRCSTCCKYFLDKEGKNSIDSPVVITHSGHSWGSVYFLDDVNDTHYTKCTNTLCDARNESSHVYGDITEGRTPLKSRTCTKGAEYRKSCVCGKEGTETFTHGKGFGHVKEKHDAVASNCSAKGHKAYYTCSNPCCSGKYYADESIENEVMYDSLLLDYASHVYASRNFGTTGDKHTYICDACHKEIKTENHTKTYEHDYYEHWWTCETCSYKSEEVKHTLTGDSGKRICMECGYSETESQNESNGIEVIAIDREPHGTLSATRSGTEWTFTLTSTNSYAVPDSFMWFVGSENMENVSGNTFVFSAPDKHTYRIMCVFSSAGRYSSESMTITGGE